MNKSVQLNVPVVLHKSSELKNSETFNNRILNEWLHKQSKQNLRK